MSLFEFVSVMVSVILGLSLAQLLGGVARLARDPKRISLFAPHTVWVGTTIMGRGPAPCVDAVPWGTKLRRGPLPPTFTQVDILEKIQAPDGVR